MTTTMQPKPTLKRGDIVLVLFPDSNLRTAKPRPTVVVQADSLDAGLAQVIVAMVTSKLFRGNHPSRVPILLSSNEGKRSSLLADSIVMTDNFATVAEPAIDRVIGSVPMGRIDAALRHTLGL